MENNDLLNNERRGHATNTKKEIQRETIKVGEKDKYTNFHQYK